MTVAVAADFVCKRTFVEIVQNVVQRGSRDVALSLLCKKSLMRGDEDIRKGHETGEDVIVYRGVGAVFKEIFGLLLIDVESGSPDELLFESFDERCRIDESAAAGFQASAGNAER